MSENKPPSKTKKHTFLGRLSFVILLMVLVWFVLLYGSVFAPSSHNTQTLSVKKGDTYQSLLIKNKWQTSPLSLGVIGKLYLKFHATKPLQAGVYRIPANASLAQVVKILAQGADVAMIKVQLIEGKTIKDLYQTIKSTDGIVLEVLSPAKSPYTWQDVKADNEQVAKLLNIQTPNGNLEGWFAPDTYFFAKGTSDTVILQKLHEAQKQALQQAWQNRSRNLPYKTPYEALIMASIIEKETGIATERADVSAVFVNRLRQGMKLQTDPTIIYGLFDRYDGKIYRSNIDEKTAYNTYQIEGLPPTPIAMPSADAIKATMHPADVPYLYFVATGKGGHTFSVTLDEHNKAVADYRKVMANK